MWATTWIVLLIVMWFGAIAVVLRPPGWARKNRLGWRYGRLARWARYHGLL